MSTTYNSVSGGGAGNGMPCDFCDRVPVGWTEVSKRNRSIGGIEAKCVYMACEEHILVGQPVYPIFRKDDA